MVVRGKADPFLVACKELEKELDRLKSAYEMYFQGRERRPPIRLRDRFDRRIRELRKDIPNNTMMRFRVQSLWSRYTSMKSYWGRIMRQIEDGTYKRHVQRARRRRDRIERREQAQAQTTALEIDVDLDAFDLDAEVGAALDALQEDKTEPNISVQDIKPPAPAAAADAKPKIKTFGRPESASFPPVRPPVAPPRKGPPSIPAAAKKPRPAPPRPPRPARASGDVDVKHIYDKYIEARRRNKERTDNVKLETLERQIKKMVPKLQKKHAGKKIDFEVVVKNGKVGLKPVAKD